MSTYGPIAYEDWAELNAQWGIARPAVHGLGATYGQHEYRDVSYLNARLRPIWPAVVGMPPDLSSWAGSLSGNSLGVTDAGSVTADDIKRLQTSLNVSLTAEGYNTITVDGKLGPKTCGAFNWYLTSFPDAMKDPAQADIAVVMGNLCAPYAGSQVAPTKIGSRTGTTTVTHVGPATSPTSAPTLGLRKSSMFCSGGGGTNWMLWGGAIAAVAVGGALIFRASKKH